MSNELEKLKSELMALPKESRAWLAQSLIESLDESIDSDVNAMWIEEIERRDSEVQSGQVVCKTADEALKEIRERLKCSK
jgi:hypothetical protein